MKSIIVATLTAAVAAQHDFTGAKCDAEPPGTFEYLLKGVKAIPTKSLNGNWVVYGKPKDGGGVTPLAPTKCTESSDGKKLETGAEVDMSCCKGAEASETKFYQRVNKETGYCASLP